VKIQGSRKEKAHRKTKITHEEATVDSCAHIDSSLFLCAYFTNFWHMKVF